MTTYKCDTCGADISKVSHYEIGEIAYRRPDQAGAPTRIHFHLEDVSGKLDVEAHEEPWLRYLDVHLCVACFQQPINLNTYIRRG